MTDKCFLGFKNFWSYWKAVKLYNTRQYSIKEIEELTGVKKSTLYRNL